MVGVDNIPLDIGLNTTQQWLYQVCTPIINEIGQEYADAVSKQFNGIIIMSVGLFFIVLALAYYYYKISKDYKQLDRANNIILEQNEVSEQMIARLLLEKKTWLDDLLLQVQKDCPANKSWGEAVGVYVSAWSSVVDKNWSNVARHDFSYKKVLEYFGDNSVNGEQ